MSLNLRANTAVDVLIGPFVDSTDGNTTEDGLTLSQADIKLSKNGQALAQKNDATAAAFDDDGYYNCELDATDTNTEGQLVLIVHESGALPVRHEFNVLSEAAWDSLYVAKDDGFMDVNIKTVGRADTQETEANNLESACANYSTTRGLSGTALPAAVADAAGGLPISDAGGLDMDSLYTYAVSSAAWGSINSGIVFRGTVGAADPGVSFTIGGLAGQGAGAFIDANTPWYAYVFRDAGGAAAAPQGEQQKVTGYTTATGLFTTDAFTVPVAVGDDVMIMSGRIATVPDILTDTGTTLPATLATIAGYIDTEVGAIKAVTDNLPDSGALTTIGTDTARLTAARAAVLDDWIDGGRLDNLLDGVGDPWSTALPGAYGAGTAGKIVGDALASHIAQTGDTYALANGATGFAAIDTVVDAIKAVTDNLPDSGALTTISTDTARLTAARAAVLTDWIDGGRLDTILDAVSGGGATNITTETTIVRSEAT
jgi:hypothetical protein